MSILVVALGGAAGAVGGSMLYKSARTRWEACSVQGGDTPEAASACKQDNLVMRYAQGKPMLVLGAGAAIGAALGFLLSE